MGRQRYAMGARVVGVVVLALVAGVLGLGPASAAPSAAPAPVRQLLAETHHRAGAHAATGTRQALRLPGDDVEAYLFVNPRCAPGQGKARPVAGVDASAKITLDWVLTSGGLRKTGTVKVKKVGRDTSITLPKLRTGAYRLTLAVHGRTTSSRTRPSTSCPAWSSRRAAARSPSPTRPATRPRRSPTAGTSSGSSSRSRSRRARPGPSGSTTPRSTSRSTARPRTRSRTWGTARSRSSRSASTRRRSPARWRSRPPASPPAARRATPPR